MTCTKALSALVDELRSAGATDGIIALVVTAFGAFQDAPKSRGGRPRKHANDTARKRAWKKGVTKPASGYVASDVITPPGDERGDETPTQGDETGDETCHAPCDQGVAMQRSLAKTIRNILAGVPGEKLRVKGYRWVSEKKEPPEKRQLISADVFAW
jgi:hypothetical protein